MVILPHVQTHRLAALLLGALLVLLAGEAMAIEKAEYEVERSDGAFELRLYSSHIVAETIVEGDFSKVGNEGFRRLVAYIGGENEKKESISMTAPVSQERQSQKIEMTAPVTQEQQGEAYRITFLMPSRFSMDELPRPLDSRVRLVEEPGRRIAAIRYRGTWSESRYREHEEKLRAWIAEQQLIPTGQKPVWARYDPPFMPWFLRRNEILIPVTVPESMD
jgi:hypothetical protein